MRFRCIPCVLVLLWGCSSDQQPAGPSAVTPCEGYRPWETSAYVLPYPPGVGYPLIQGNCSNGPTHTAARVFKYGYDFLMPIGSGIHAARDGRVLDIRESATDFNGTTSPANYVWVTHDDGFIGRYWHLTQNGALVEPGQLVKTGDLIALSGATGLITEPHLHFDEAVCGPNTCATRPTTYRNTDPNPNGLQVGRTYVARPY